MTKKLSADRGVNENTCRDPEAEGGVVFHHRLPEAASYRWGQIPDFDETIFYEYARKQNTESEASMEFPIPTKRYQAGQEFSFHVRFPISTRVVRLEQAVRCADGKLIWAPFYTVEQKNKVMRTITTEIHNSGPNNDGHQFLRLMAYDIDENLVAWAIDDLFVHSFESGFSIQDPKACRRSGS